jgi:CheY-like chemotaxis protein
MTEIDDLIETFRCEATEILGELGTTLSAQRGRQFDRTSSERAARLAHNLKGASLTVGAKSMAESCSTIEAELDGVVDAGALRAEQLESWLNAVAEMHSMLEAPDLIAIPPRAAMATTQPVSHRILVVDDSLIVRTVEAEMLASAGFDVSVSSDGEEAWATLEQGQFDLVVCDVQMPNVDGWELTRRIRASAKLRDLAILLVTGRTGPEDLLRGVEVGANGYIAKDDLGQENLVAAVRRLISESRRLDSSAAARL